jgi:hypothetical protein
MRETVVWMRRMRVAVLETILADLMVVMEGGLRVGMRF